MNKTVRLAYKRYFGGEGIRCHEGYIIQFFVACALGNYWGCLYSLTREETQGD